MIKKNTKKKPLISALEPRILFDGAAVTTAVDVLDNNSFTDTTNSDDSTDTITDNTSNTLTENFPIESGDIFIITTDTPDYELTAQNFGSDFKVLLLDQSSSDLQTQILDATKDLDSELNVHIIALNQSQDKLLVGSYDSVNDLINSFDTQDSKIYDLNELIEQDLTPSGENQVIIIDESISYSQDLLDTIPSDWKIITIDSSKDGLTQILEKLEGISNISALHIFSHANSGEIILGNLTLDLNTLKIRANDLKTLGTHLTSSGDILLYGCDVSSGFIGQEFVNEFAILSEADIAASDDATGSYISNANFNLETNVGNIETQTITYDTNGTILGYINNYTFNIDKNGPRLNYQASGEAFSGWWNGTDNNWVDYYTSNREVSYFGIKWVTVNALFFSFSFPIPWVNYYSYGTGVRYGIQEFTVDHDSRFYLSASADSATQNQLGGDRTQNVLSENYALYKIDENGVGFDKYNPLKNLVTASEGLLAGGLYLGDLKAGKYQVVASFDNWRWWPDIISLMTLNQYAEQFFEPVTLRVENLNRAPVWGSIANQTIDGDGDKSIIATTWSNVSDADGDELSASAVLWDGSSETALPYWLSFNPNSLTFSGNPPANTGTLNVRIKAYDGQEYGYRDFTLTFTNDNDQAIVANEIPNQTWDGEGSFSYIIPSDTFTDADPDADSFTYTAKLSNGNSLPSWLSLNSVTGEFTGNPPADFNSLEITVTANDGSGQDNATQTDTFILNLKNNNDIPVVTNITKTINEDTTYSFTLSDFIYSAGDTHADDDTTVGNGKDIQSIRIVELPSNGTLWLDSNSDGVLDSGEVVLLNQSIITADITKLKFTPNKNWAGHGILTPLEALLTGPDSFKWAANDGYDDSNIATTTINVLLINDDPELSFSEGKSLNIRPNGGANLLPVYVDEGLNLIDPDSAYTDDVLFDTIFGISVTIIDSTTNSFINGDTLSLTGDTTGYSISYDSVNGILSIESTTGGATAAQYQTLLRTLQFSSTDTTNNHERTLGLSFRTQDVGSKSSAYFDGVDDYIETMNPSIPTTGDFTVSLWSKLDTASLSENGQYTMFGQGDSSSHIFLQIEKLGSTYNLRVGNDWSISGLDSILSDGKWHQYTVVRSGSGATDGSLYIDGKYISSGDIKDSIASGYGLRIGRLYDQTINSSADWTGYWKGSISDIRVFNKVLSSVDIQQSLSSQLTGSEAGLKAWYKLENDYINYAGSDTGNAIVFKDAGYGYSIKTGHYYYFNNTGQTWSSADATANSSTYAGENGYLINFDDASLSASEKEIAKLMGSLNGDNNIWTGLYRSGAWYWGSGPDSDVAFTHDNVTEGLDNNPSYWNNNYGPTGWWGRFGNGNWQYAPWISTNGAQTQITFTFYAWDSWDNEAFAVNLNDNRMFNLYTTHDTSSSASWSSTVYINGKPVTYSIYRSSGWNMGVSGWWDHYYNVTVDIPENFASSVRMSFGAYTDQDLGDESAEIVNYQVKTVNPDYLKDRAYMNSVTGYIDNTYSSDPRYSLIEYGNRGEYLTAPSLFATTNSALPDKYVNETRTITVRETNNAPTQTASWTIPNINEDTQYNFKVSDFTSQFSDTDGDTLNKITITSIPDASKGILELNGVTLSNGDVVSVGDIDKLILKPNTNYFGDISFKYKASDGYLFSNESAVNINVNSINDAPILNANQTLISINEDILNSNNLGQTIASLISDGSISDADGNPLEAVAITSVNNSYGTWQYKTSSSSTTWSNISNINGAIVNLGANTLLLDGDSLVRFVVNENYNGTSTFTFRAWDKSTGIVGGTTDPYKLGGNNSVSIETKTATITINEVNDAPETLSKIIDVKEDIAYIFTLDDFKFSDIDENDALETVVISSLPSNGILKLDGVNVTLNQAILKTDIQASKLTYLSALNEFGDSYTSFNFKVNDGDTSSTEASITFNISDENDAPTDIAWLSGGSVAENSEEGIVVGQLNGTDPDTLDTLRFSRLENSKFIISTTGLVTVAKDAYLDYEKNTIQTIKVKVTDSQGLTYIKDITINITDIVENTPTLYTNVLYMEKNSVTTLTESYIRTEDADTSDINLIYTVKQAIDGGILFIDNNSNDTYDEGIDSLLGPESSDTPEYEANFTHQDVLDGKIKFYKNDSQINAKIYLDVSDGNTIDDGMVVVIVSNPPVLSAAIDDQEWGLSGVQNFTLPASTFTDADFDVLTYSAVIFDETTQTSSILPSWLSFDTKTGKFTGTPIGLNDGDTIKIKVSATDGRTTPASDIFVITFKATITKPVIANPLPEYIEFSGSGIKDYTIPLDTFSNPVAATSLTYSATLGDGSSLPSWLSFNTTTLKFSGNPPASAVSEPLILKITADNTTATTSTTIKLYVSDSNDIPVNSAIISDKVINDANSHTYTIDKSTFSDGDNDAITLSLVTQDGSEVPSWVKTTIDSSGNLIITAKAPAGSGFQNLRVLGSDGNGGEAVSDFKITYSGGSNESPQVKTDAGISYMQNGILVTSSYGALEKFSILAGKTSTITTTYLDENDTDDDGEGLTYTIVNEPMYGQLWIDSDGNGTINGSETTLSSGDTFTQKDIDDRKLKYNHTAANTNDDRFIFNLKDGGENGSVEVKNVTFNIDVLENPTSLSMISVKRYIPTDVLTNEDEIKFKAKFSGVAFGVDASDFEVTGAGNLGATISGVENLGSNEYMITVSNITSNNGDIGIALASSTNIITTGGSSIDDTFVPTINETFTLDNIQPTVIITPDRTIYAGTTTFNATLTFSEKVINLSIEDITVSNAIASNLIQIDDTHFTIDVTPSGDTNDITLDFASDCINDLAGNTNTTATQVIITRNEIPTISNINSTATFTEVDGVDITTNDVLFTLNATTSLGDIDSSQDLQSLSISIPTASILDGEKEELIVNGTVIPLNFTNGKAISNIMISGVEYKITATISGTNSTLSFEKVSGKMTLSEAEALLDVVKYNNSSDTPTTSTDRVFSLVVNDGLENSIASTSTITVVATNDTPTINVEAGNSASESLTETNTTLNTSGTLSIVDLDTNQTVSVSKVGIVTSGVTTGLNSDNTALLAMLNLDSGNVINNSETNGITNWIFNSGNEYFDYLAVDEVLTLTYTIKATDSSTPSAYDTQDIVITIIGTNDKPNITASTTTALDNSSSPVNASGTISFDDIDATDTPTASFTKATDTNYSATRTDNTTTFSLNTAAVSALQDALTLNNDGSWSYSLDTTLLKDTADTFIASGDKISIVYTITISDGHTNGSITKDLKFNLIGTGTGASLVVSGDAGSIVEGLKLSDAGSLTFDGQANITTATINSIVNITPTNITLTTAQETAIKNALLVNVADNITTDAVNWTYNIAEANLDFLPANEIVTAIFTIDIFDNSATPLKIGSQDVTIVINGTNDTPLITSITADARGSVTEAGDSVLGTANATGTLTSSDVDDGATASWSLNTTAGTYGDITIDSSTGTWTYTIDETKAASLQTGDRKTETFIATISDGTATAQQTILVEVKGTNDAPVLAIPITITYTDTANDDTFTSQSGTLSSSDDDAGDTKIFNITGQSTDITQSGFTHSKIGTYGTLYLNAINGNYKYIPNDAAIEALTVNASETFNFTVSDSLGADNTQTLTISLTGVNDSPIVTVASNDSDLESIYETNSTLETTGTLTVTDLDLLNNVSSVVVQSMTIDGNSSTEATPLSWLTLNTNSILSNSQTTDTLTWIFNSGSEYFNGLSQGDTKTLVYTIRINDGIKDIDKVITINILGTNDAPIISVETGDSISIGLTETNTGLSASDTITINEIELNDQVSSKIESVSINASSTVSTLAIPSNSVLKTMLSLDKTTLLSDNSTLNEQITWSFNSNTEAFNEIANGETLVLDYVIKVWDNASTSKVDTQIVQITITGTNDAPTITVVDIDGQVESGKPLELSTSGSINFVDIDFSNRPTATETLKSLSAINTRSNTIISLSTTQQTTFENAFSISSLGTNTNDGKIIWDYSIDQTDLDFLGSGEVITAVFTITVSDTNGATATQDVTLTIVGKNNIPEISGGPGISNLIETDSTLNDTITLNAKDTNLSDSVIAEVLSGKIKRNNESFEDMSLTQLSWLSLTNYNIIDSSNTTDAMNWIFDSGSEYFNNLDSTEKLTLVYTVKITDDSPATDSDTETITITIQGTNDAPISVIDNLNIVENGIQSLDVLVNDTDSDSSDNITNFSLVSISNVIINHRNDYDSLKVETPSTFTIVNNKIQINPGDEFEYLAEGENITATLSYTMSDDEGSTATQDITITITGTNDTPEIQIVDVSGSIVEGTTLSDNGSIKFTDVDLNNKPIATQATKSISVLAQNGTNVLVLTATQQQNIEDAFTINNTSTNTNNGEVTWDYTISEDELDFLGQGETVTAVFTITVTDDEGSTATQDITITITGTNDNPTVNTSSNLYVQIGFGEQLEPNNLKDHFGFADKDLTDKFKFELINGPKGIIIDPNTGVISGKPSQSGNFTITVKVMDDEGAFVTKEFEMLVVAPPQIETKAPTEPNGNNELAQQIVKEITVDRITDMISTFGDVSDNKETKTSDDGLSGLINAQNGESGKQNTNDGTDITRTELTTIVRDGGNNPDGKLVKADLNLSVGNDGKVKFGEKSTKAFETVGLSIEKMDLQNEQIEIKILDTRTGQKYIVSLIDGTVLPETLSFDPNTGIVKGTLPAGMEELALSIKALSSDGTTRILNIKIDVNQLKEQQKQNEAKFETLREQIEAQNDSMNNYGSKIAALFVS